MRTRIHHMLIALVILTCMNTNVSAVEKPQIPGPSYSNLRYDEDFSYLAGPEGSY